MDKEGVIQTIKGILFPSACVECGSEGEWWCAVCRLNMKPNWILFCPSCNEEKEQCACTQRAPAELDEVVALFNLKKARAVHRLIRLLKYSFTRDALDIFGSLLNELPSRIEYESGVVVVPIPLHTRRARERGFNQASLIARLVAGRYELPCAETVLTRARYTRQQAKLNKKERETNIDSAFVWKGEKSPPSHVLLVDDVYTTGATAREAAKALKRAGAEWVGAFVLAHG